MARWFVIGFIAAIFAFFGPYANLFATRLDLFKDKSLIEETENAKRCCLISAYGESTFPADVRSLLGASKENEKLPASACAVHPTDFTPKGNATFPMDGFEDLIYVHYPSEGGVTHPNPQDMDRATHWGALSCAGNVHQVFDSHDGPLSIGDGECALILHGGDRIEVIPVPIRHFPSMRVVFHPHGLFRSFVGDRPIDGFPSIKDLPTPTHEDSSQRIYAVNHGYGKGDEGIVVFRLVYSTASTTSHYKWQPELYYEGEIAHASYGTLYRGAFNDLVVDDRDPLQSTVHVSTFMESPHSIGGKHFPEHFTQRFDLAIGLAHLFFDSLGTKLLNCPFSEIDVVSSAAVSSTAAEEEEDEAADREASKGQSEGALHPPHNDIDFKVSQRCSAALNNLHGNGVSSLWVRIPTTTVGAKAKNYQLIFAVDFSRHSIVVSLHSPGASDATVRVIRRIPIVHVVDNIELDYLSLRQGQYASVDGRSNFVTMKEKKVTGMLEIQGVRFYTGSILSLKSALALFRDVNQNAEGGISELVINIAFDYDLDRRGLQPFSVELVSQRDLVRQDGTRLAGVSTGLVLRSPTAHEDLRTRGDTTLGDEVLVMGSYVRHGLLVCPMPNKKQ